jgi:hypothetical protein
MGGGGVAGSGEIQVRPLELLEKSKIALDVGYRLKNSLDEVHGIMTEFFNSDIFEGQQAAQVRENYATARENLDRFPVMVVWLGGQLETAANTFINADKDNVTIYAESVYLSTVLPLLPAEMQEGFLTRMATDDDFAAQVLAWLESQAAGLGEAGEPLVDGAEWIADNPRKFGAALRATKALVSLYKVSQGTNTVLVGLDLVEAGSLAKASKFSKGIAVAGAVVTLGVGMYDAFTGADQSPEAIAAQISSGLIQSAMGFTGIGTVILSTDALIQFVGPIVSDVMRSNASFFAGGGINEQDIIGAANKFDQAIQDISLDARLDGTFKSLYSGDLAGVGKEMLTLMEGSVAFMDSGIQLGAYMAGGLIDKIIPGAGGPVAATLMIAGQWSYHAFTMPARALTFAYDLFTGDASIGDLFSGTGDAIGSIFDLMGLDGAGDWVRNISGAIGGAVDSAVDATIQFAEDAWNTAMHYGGIVSNGIVTGANWVGDNVGGGLVTAGNAIANFFTGGGGGGC